MTKSWFIQLSAHRLVQPNRSSILVQSDAENSAGNVQPFISWADEDQSRPRTSWHNASKTKVGASIKDADPTKNALSP